MGTNSSANPENSGASSQSQMNLHLGFVVNDIWVQILHALDIKALLSVSTTCRFFQTLFLTNDWETIFDSRRNTSKPIPEGFIPNLSVLAKQKFMSPEIFRFEHPWNTPSDLSFAKFFHVKIHVNHDLDVDHPRNKSELQQNLRDLLMCRARSDLKSVCLSGVPISRGLGEYLGIHSMTKLTLENCRMIDRSFCLNWDRPVRYNLFNCEAFKNLKRLHITIEGDREIRFRLPGGLEELSLYAYSNNTNSSGPIFQIDASAACSFKYV